LYWPGDDKAFSTRLFLSRLPGEFWDGVDSLIPMCCVIWYISTICLCRIFGDVRTMTKLFGADGWERFEENDYYQCPLCRYQKRVVPILWWSGE